ncbi:MAG TPA: DUF1801 domain-containing protein [Rubricoccaceae bacterium]|jgi:uncharacterized protein YdhG (YjbR/CyaY superfamily)
MPRPQTVDEYLAPLSAEKRAALERVQETVRAAVPGAEEGMSYGIPAFRLGGRWPVGFGAATHHCALYGVAETRPGELNGYDTSGKGTLRFRPDAPLPDDLVRRLVLARAAKEAAPR